VTNETTATKTPAVSVLLPVFNGLPYVREAIDSIVCQTLTDWELIIVDNCSTDGTYAYLESRAAQDPRIVLLRNEVNLGIAGGLNRGLAHCRAGWVARMDADDRALPKRLERQLAFVNANPDVVTASCLAHYINTTGRRIGVTTSLLTTREAFQRQIEREEPIVLLHPGALIRRDVLNAVGGYRGEFTPAEDIDLWGRLSERGLLLVQSEYLMEYRVHAGSTMAVFFELARLKHEWARVCMVARRHDQPEPAWAQFEAEWQQAPVWRRLHRGRRILSEHLARIAREDLASGRRFGGLSKLATAALMRPFYSAPRLRVHLQAGLSR
jgi:glycosyltransferase involved in cell wall biosynthesis